MVAKDKGVLKMSNSDHRVQTPSWKLNMFSSVQFSSVAQSCLTLNILLGSKYSLVTRPNNALLYTVLNTILCHLYFNKARKNQIKNQN